MLRAAIERKVLNLTGHAVGGIDYDQPRGDPGLFGPNAVCWRVHGDFSSMLVGGISALLLQMLHPLVLAGVWDHSNFRADMLGRLRRTARFISATTFAPKAQALGEIERVKAIHLAVTGKDASGRPYAASDPGLLTWVHVAEMYSFLNAYLAYGPVPLPEVDKDRYFAETALVAEALGATDVPKSHRDAKAYLLSKRGSLRVDDRTIDVFHALLNAPAPDWLAALMRSSFMAAGVANLPEFAKALYGSELKRARTKVPALVRLTAPIIRWSLVNSAAARARRRVA